MRIKNAVNAVCGFVKDDTGAGNPANAFIAQWQSIRLVSERL